MASAQRQLEERIAFGSSAPAETTIILLTCVLELVVPSFHSAMLRITGVQPQLESNAYVHPNELRRLSVLIGKSFHIRHEDVNYRPLSHTRALSRGFPFSLRCQVTWTNDRYRSIHIQGQHYFQDVQDMADFDSRTILGKFAEAIREACFLITPVTAPSQDIPTAWTSRPALYSVTQL